MVSLKAVSSKIKHIAGKNLVSMIVFGSYARGDNKPDSDVDLVIIVKDKNKQLIDDIKKLEDELSIDGNSRIELRISHFLNLIGFKKNLFLFSDDEWANKNFNFCDSRFLAKLLIPKGVIWSSIKKEGKVIFGKKLLNFNAKISVWDKIKAPLPGIGACVMACFVLLFNKDKAVSLAQTGLRWTYMNVKGCLKRSNINTIRGNFKEVLKVSLNL